MIKERRRIGGKTQRLRSSVDTIGRGGQGVLFHFTFTLDREKEEKRKREKEGKGRKQASVRTPHRPPRTVPSSPLPPKERRRGGRGRGGEKGRVTSGNDINRYAIPCYSALCLI